MTETKVAIVTAAGRGIGAACATALAEAGYAPVLMSPSGSARALADELGGVGMDGSVLETDDLQRLVDLAMERHGRIDAVVNNSGHGAGTTAYNTFTTFDARDDVDRMLLEITDDEWHDGLDMYVLSVMRMARIVTPIMRDQGGGAILNISSMAVFEPRPASPMSVLRGALAGYTKLYADRYGGDGIRMNNLLPGFMENTNPGEDVLRGIPAARAGTMAELGKTAAFLVSPDAGYITGQNILLDGGLNRAVR
jgi:NAD(P)-dependent dehydrogenase (short-subunit alcohol dehydrogenase family)